MSKTVTIPNCANPFIVWVNGAKYSYPAGTEQEVPDEVAEIIEAHHKKHEEPSFPTEAPFGGGGGVSSWNDLTDKPFGDSPTGGDALKWDGNTEGLVSAGGSAYKVSDAIPTMADLANGCTITLSTGETFEITADNMGDLVIDFTVSGMPGIAIAEFALIALEDNADLSEIYGSFVAPKKGVYFMNLDGMFTSSLTIPGYTGFPSTKKIDPKYLPEVAEEFKVTFSPNADGTGYEPDKTYWEMYNAYKDGKKVCGVLANSANDHILLSVCGVNGDEVTFHTVEVASGGEGAIIYLYCSRTGGTKLYMAPMTFTQM